MTIILNFSGYNQIDMDMDYDPDLDDDFSIKSVNTFDDFDDESEDRPVRKSVWVFADFNDDDEYEYKIVRIKLIPFIFTEKYEQVKY